MNSPNTLVESDGEWMVRNSRREQLVITLHEVLSDSDHPMGVDPGLVKDGVEAHLQELLASDPSQVASGLKLIRREHPTDIGPVDLLCRDLDGRTVAIEVKRRGEIDGVEQLSRYLDFLNRDPMLRPVSGILVAQNIRPQARLLAGDRGIGCVVVDYDDLRGLESDVLKLF